MKRSTSQTAGAARAEAGQEGNAPTRAWGLGALAVACTLVAGFLLWRLAGAPDFTAIHRSSLGLVLKKWTYYPAYALVVDTLARPLFWVLFGGILVLEKLFPARREQKLFSVSFAQDLVWFFFSMTVGVVFIGAYVTILRDFYADHLTFLTVEPIRALPEWARFAWGVLLTDFLRWLHHWVRHKVPVFWHFHAVHHSQKELNLFTQLRYHILEYIIAHTISTIPLLMLAVDVPVIVAWNIFHMWFARFYHANIRMNLGPLRYVLVTPQSHRIHHSNLAEHQDKNFGVMFSIWDRLLGTQIEDADLYPETGIHDRSFPHEKTARGVALITTPIAQHLYPFRAIWRDWRAKHGGGTDADAPDNGQTDAPDRGRTHASDNDSTGAS